MKNQKTLLYVFFSVLAIQASTLLSMELDKELIKEKIPHFDYWDWQNFFVCPLYSQNTEAKNMAIKAIKKLVDTKTLISIEGKLVNPLNIEDSNFNLLKLVLRTKQFDLAQYLLDKGANPELKVTPDNIPLLEVFELGSTGVSLFPEIQEEDKIIHNFLEHYMKEAKHEKQ